MMTDHEWNLISRKAFPKKSVKAPPFLWTRILSKIEAEETRRAGAWWLQWRWMSRVTVAVGLLVSLGSFYLLNNNGLSLDALDGPSQQLQALQLASSDISASDDDSIALVVELDS